MNRSSRLLITVTLSLLLPLTGMAGVAAPAQPCPHQMDMAQTADVHHACCDVERSAELGYKVCKPGQENCHVPVLFWVPPVKGLAIPCGRTILARYDGTAPRQNAEAFWRPPRV